MFCLQIWIRSGSRTSSGGRRRRRRRRSGKRDFTKSGSGETDTGSDSEDHTGGCATSGAHIRSSPHSCVGAASGSRPHTCAGARHQAGADTHRAASARPHPQTLPGAHREEGARACTETVPSASARLQDQAHLPRACAAWTLLNQQGNVSH